MIRVFFHRSKCIGCNACVEADKHRWRISRSDGKSNLISSTEKKGIYRVDVHNEEYETLMLAAATCPVKIIQVEEK
ncbi:MAG: ferredoxin [Bacteroidota bacterium]